MTVVLDGNLPSADILVTSREVVDAITSDPTLALTMHAHQLRIGSLQRRIDVINSTIMDERTSHEEWREALICTAHQIADENEWCSNADQALERAGLPPRPDKEVEVDWTATITVRTGVFDDGDVNDALVRAATGGELDADSDGVEVEFEATVTVNYTVRGTRTTTPDTCVCGSIERGDVYVCTPSWLDHIGWDFDSDVEVNCDAC
jgi:hypothetical protein